MFRFRRKKMKEQKKSERNLKLFFSCFDLLKTLEFDSMLNTNRVILWKKLGILRMVEME